MIPCQYGRYDCTSSVSRLCEDSQPLAEAQYLIQTLDAVDLVLANVKPTIRVTPDPNIVISWREEDMAKCTGEHTQCFLEDHVIGCDISRHNENIALEGVTLDK